ncbi:DeoR family transcriptional regulator [Mycolicibacterium palauense]|uniref:DeoR family transcriptional regulator n=1 Tax=Mycolicibacterium palauense TaxID=2034511 RepID=UPI003898DE40
MANGMSAHLRRAAIAERIDADREVDFTSLATEFGVSAMTIRRDIEKLESEGIARRVLGGAIALGGKSTEPSFAARAAAAAAGKVDAGQLAGLRPGATVCLSADPAAVHRFDRVTGLRTDRS